MLNELKMNLINLNPLLIGDIIICKEILLKQSKEFKISWEEELVHLFLHGLLHLLGFDHERSRSEEKLMFSLEEKLVNQVFVRIKKNLKRDKGIKGKVE